MTTVCLRNSLLSRSCDENFDHHGMRSVSQLFLLESDKIYQGFHARKWFEYKQT